MSKSKTDVVYPKVSVLVCGTEEETGYNERAADKIREALAAAKVGTVFDIQPPMTAERMREILGWEEEVEGGEKFNEGEYQLKDRYGKKVRLNNNPHNRPLYQSNYEGMVQEVLNRRHKFNGETMIIGKNSNVNDGQHSGIALVLAQQEVEKYPEKWGGNWPDGKVTMSRVFVFGISEDDEVINTIDTGKSRSLTDVIYRTDLFSKMGKTRKAEASKILEFAVRRLWVRTGVHRDAEAPRRTHSEAMDFVERHKSLLKTVKFLMGEEPKRGKKPKTTNDETAPTAGVKDYVPLGYAAAMLYLMSASKTEFDHYYKDGVIRGDRRLDLSNTTLAEQFWVDLVSNPKFQCVRDEIASLHEHTGVGGRLDEVDYVICAAWNLYSKGQKLTTEGVEVKYTRKPDAKGRVYPINVPVVRDAALGIDLGNDGTKGESSTSEKKAVEQRKKEEDAKKVESNGHVPSADPLATVRKRYKSVDVFVAKGSSGGLYFLWDEDADKAAEALRTEPRPHPSGRSHIPIRGEELESCVEVLNKSGLTVGVAQAMNDDWVVEVSKGKKVTTNSGG